jgi:hypothetical protein
MKNIKLKYVWLSIILAFILSCVLVYLCSITEGMLLTVMIVLLVITFIYMTIAVQYAGAKTFKYKPKKIIYPTISYECELNDIETTLKKCGFKERKVPYGLSYLKIKNKIAYKVVLVKEENKYFNQEEETQEVPVNKELEKCEKFMGFEIFIDISQENLYRLPDFSIQGKNVYYTAYYISNENELTCLNYVEANEDYKEAYNNLINDLKFKEINQEDNND